MGQKKMLRLWIECHNKLLSLIDEDGYYQLNDFPFRFHVKDKASILSFLLCHTLEYEEEPNLVKPEKDSLSVKERISQGYDIHSHFRKHKPGYDLSNIMEVYLGGEEKDMMERIIKQKYTLIEDPMKPLDALWLQYTNDLRYLIAELTFLGGYAIMISDSGISVYINGKGNEYLLRHALRIAKMIQSVEGILPNEIATIEFFALERINIMEYLPWIDRPFFRDIPSIYTEIRRPRMQLNLESTKFVRHLLMDYKPEQYADLSFELAKKIFKEEGESPSI